MQIWYLPIYKHNLSICECICRISVHENLNYSTRSMCWAAIVLQRADTGIKRQMKMSKSLFRYFLGWWGVSINILIENKSKSLGLKGEHFVILL